MNNTSFLNGSLPFLVRNFILFFLSSIVVPVPVFAFPTAINTRINSYYCYQPHLHNRNNRIQSSSVVCSMEYSSSYIKNFRQAAYLPRVIRCAETDCLANVADTDEHMTDTGVELIMERTGLILDLRSPSERNEQKATVWMKNAGFEVSNNLDVSGNEKKVLRVDILSPTRLFQYLSDNWLTPSERALSAVYFAVNVQKRNALQMDVLNKRGRK